MNRINFKPRVPKPPRRGNRFELYFSDAHLHWDEELGILSCSECGEKRQLNLEGVQKVITISNAPLFTDTLAKIASEFTERHYRCVEQVVLAD